MDKNFKKKKIFFNYTSLFFFYYYIYEKTIIKPITIDFSVIYYNEYLLNKYNQEVPKTWDQLIKTGKYIYEEELKRNNLNIIPYNGMFSGNDNFYFKKKKIFFFLIFLFYFYYFILLFYFYYFIFIILIFILFLLLFFCFLFNIKYNIFFLKKKFRIIHVFIYIFINK